MATATIFGAFAYTPAANNYASFYDDSRVNWSVLFEGESQAISFAKQVGLARFSAAKSNELIIQG